MNNQHGVACCPHRELAVGWALHALQPSEASPVAAHIPDCSICTKNAAETEEVGATLGLPSRSQSPALNWSTEYSAS